MTLFVYNFPTMRLPSRYTVFLRGGASGEILIFAGALVLGRACRCIRCRLLLWRKGAPGDLLRKAAPFKLLIDSYAHLRNGVQFCKDTYWCLNVYRTGSCNHDIPPGTIPRS